MSYVFDLLEALIGLGVGQEIAGSVDAARDPHLTRPGYLPQVIVNLFKFHSLPVNL
jgi:hypothetical protein